MKLLPVFSCFSSICGQLLRVSAEWGGQLLVDAVHRGHRVHQDHGLPDDRVDRGGGVGCPQLSILYSFLPVLRIRTFIDGFETFQNVRIRLFGSVFFMKSDSIRVGSGPKTFRIRNTGSPPLMLDSHWLRFSPFLVSHEHANTTCSLYTTYTIVRQLPQLI